MPRVLEQAYLDHYTPELNGKKIKFYQVVFNFLKWSSSSLSSSVLLKDSSISKIVKNSDDKNNVGDEAKKELHKYIAKDEYNNIVAGSNSLNGLSSLLGINLQGLKFHLNRESFVLAKSLSLNVSVQENNVVPKGKPIEYYKPKKASRSDLILSIDLSFLEMGNIFIYSLDKKTVIAKRPTSPLVNSKFKP